MSAETVRVQTPFHFEKGVKGFKIVRAGTPSHQVGPGRIPRVSKLMALAIRYDEMIQNGTIGSYAEIADLGYLTRARLTQIMDLLLLAPQIIEEILFLPKTLKGPAPIGERDLRAISREKQWRAQERLWRLLKRRKGLHVL